MPNGLTFLEYIRASGVVSALFLLVGAFVAGRLMAGFTESLGGRFTAQRLLIHRVGTFARYVLFTSAAILALLLSFRFSNEMLVAVGGTLAVAFGFALKDISSSVVGGLIILVDKPFQVGDRISFAGTYGEVLEIGLRSVRVKTLDEQTVTIPNGRFLTESVASVNGGALHMQIELDFYIGADQDLAKAKEIVSEALTSSRYAYLNEPWTVLVHQLMHDSYFAIRLRARIHALDMRFEEALETDVTERVLEGFRLAGIRPPTVQLAWPQAGVLPGDGTR